MVGAMLWVCTQQAINSNRKKVGKKVTTTTTSPIRQNQLAWVKDTDEA